MEFIRPTFTRKEKPTGIYILWFDDKWFYIGSSTNIRRRLCKWAAVFKNTKYLDNKTMGIVLNKCSIIRAEILQIVEDSHDLTNIETKYIQQNWGSNFILNRIPDACTLKGRKPYEGFLKKQKIVKGEVSKPKKIGTFKKTGELIKIYNSRSLFVKETKFTSSIINKILSGEKGQHHKFDIKNITDDGNIIEPPIATVKKKGKAKGYKHSVGYIPPTAKEIIQYSTHGIEIGRFKAGTYAALHIGTKPETFLKTINVSKTGYHKGYVWKYA
jgi:hypothetical protein